MTPARKLERYLLLKKKQIEVREDSNRFFRLFIYKQSQYSFVLRFLQSRKELSVLQISHYFNNLPNYPIAVIRVELLRLSPREKSYSMLYNKRRKVQL